MLLEVVAKKLFNNKSLQVKHQKYLDWLQWNKSPGSKNIKFFQAKFCTNRRGVLDEKVQTVPNPQSLFVDDYVYVEVYEDDREQSE